MRIGSPGFIGQNMKEARESRCISPEALAEITKIEKKTIYSYESGRRTPPPDALERIVDALSFPEGYFFQPWDEEVNDKVFFRSLRSAEREPRMRARVRHRWVARICAYVSQFTELPTLDIPNWGIPDFRELTGDDIESYTEQLRDFWGLGDGPLGNITWLLESRGFITASSDLNAASLDALSAWLEAPDARPIFLIGTEKRSAVRGRFDCAHELAHVLLHRDVEGRFLDKTSPEYTLLENQAHRFASAFLFPKKSYLREVFQIRLEAFQAIKPKWGTSIGMLISRAKALGLIDDVECARLWKMMSKRGWRKWEPLDETIQVESPFVLRKSFELIVEEGIKTRSEIRGELPIPPGDVESLCGLPSGFLDDSQPQVQVIEFSSS